MIPRLYESSETDPNTEGLGALQDLLSVSITRNYNEIPTLSLTYPVDGRLSKVIEQGMIIVADMGSKDFEKNQKFRIVDISDEIDSMTITANHIWADLSSIPLKQNVGAANATPKFAFNLLKDALAWPMPEISLKSDIYTVANVNWNLTDIDNANAAIIGTDAAGDTATNALNVLYNGELQFDNYNLSLLKHAGQDNNLVIKYGRNMESFSRDDTTSDTYNAIMPYVTLEANNDVEDEETTSNQPAVQNLTNGSIPIYDSPYSGQDVTDTLNNSKFVKLVSSTNQNTINKRTWYKTETGGWIDERWITRDNSSKYLINPISAQGTLVADKAATGVVIRNDDTRLITYQGQERQLWTSPFNGRPSSEKVYNGVQYQVSWFAKDLSGQVWYNLGNLYTEWIPAQDFYLSGDKTNAVEKVFGSLKIKGDVEASEEPSQGTKISWKNQGSYNVYEMQVAKGSKWYHLGQYNGRQVWIKEGQNATFESALFANSDPTATQQIPVYGTPEGVVPINKYYQVGSQLHITAQSYSRGEVLYEVGNGQWINSKFIDFSSANDSPPSDDMSKETQVDQHTLTLTEPVVASEFAKRTKAPLRVQAVDFSSYGVGNDRNRLLAVAKAYMKDNRIGNPNVSFTIAYEQMQGDYQQLTSVDLYDYVSVIFEKINIFEKAQCKSITWDPIREVATSITIGELPVTYTHYISQYIADSVSAGTEEAKDQATKLFNEATKNSDQSEAINELKTLFESNSHELNKKYEDVGKEVTDISNKMRNFLTGTQTGSIVAYPNWSNPTEIRAKDSTGGYIKLDNEGLTGINADGIATFKINRNSISFGDTALSKADIEWLHNQINK